MTKKFYPEIVLKGQKQRCKLRSIISDKLKSREQTSYNNRMREENLLRKSQTSKTTFYRRRATADDGKVEYEQSGAWARKLKKQESIKVNCSPLILHLII